ncbi:MAG TPA: efflux transporter outer membrane subunit [Burkholderiaceae bacterium]|nr:efflux transporter outer membrane subunit [Burkholderiaceae bacterium]
MAVLLAGCAVGPDYHRPAVDMGQQYKEVKGWVQAKPAGVSLHDDWWRLYRDPVLDGLMHTLQDANLSVAQSEAQYREARAALESTRAGLFPTVGLSSSAARAGGGTGQSGSSNFSGGGTSSSYVLSGTVTWEADLWGKVRRSVEAGQAELQASAADVAATRLSMESTLAQDYFQLRALDAEKRMYQQTVAAYERSLKVTVNRYNAGVSAKADVASAQTQLENARAQMQALEWQRAQYEHAIAVLIGKPPSRFSLAEAQSIGIVPIIPVGLPSQLLQRRPDVAAAERRTAEANAKIGVAQAAWFPDLTLSAQGGFRSGEWVNWLTAPMRFWSLGPELAMTLFDAGARSAQVEQAQAAYDAQVASYRLTALTALREAEDYMVQLRVLARQQVTQNRALAAARESLRLTTNQYDAGLIDYLSVAVVQASTLSTERAALSVTVDRLVASVQLIAALGGGWAPAPAMDTATIGAKAAPGSIGTASTDVKEGTTSAGAGNGASVTQGSAQEPR